MKGQRNVRSIKRHLLTCPGTIKGGPLPTKKTHTQTRKQIIEQTQIRHFRKREHLIIVTTERKTKNKQTKSKFGLKDP